MLLTKKSFKKPTIRRQSFAGRALRLKLHAKYATVAGSQQGRDLLETQLELGFGQKILVCTTHLESAIPPYNGACHSALPTLRLSQVLL